MLQYREHSSKILLFVLYLKNLMSEDLTAENLICPADVAKMLNISKTCVYRLKDQRIIPFFKVGGSVRFRMSDIKSYLERIRVKSIDENMI